MKEKDKKNTPKKNAKKGGSLPFFFRFYFWDEALLFPSPLHIPSTLSSVHSCNVELSNFFKPYVTKLYGAEAHELY
jgi:hypothetical protein